MIIVKLQGGLGNQMFQYAIARSLIKNTGKVYLDHNYLENNNTDTEEFTARSFELHIFKNLKAYRAKNWKINLLTSQRGEFRLLRAFLAYKKTYLRQHEHEYVVLPPFPKNTKIYLDGYFQSENYFKHLRKTLLYEFEFPPLDQLNEEIKGNILKAQNSVSIHVRRGDYLTLKKIKNVLGVLPYTYYEKAINILSSKFPELELFIFSEDIEWAKVNFTGSNTHFISHNRSTDSWKDMALMTYCKHHIIANSSFSWWGAWLAKHKGDVFAPACWFNPMKVNFNIEDIIPASWTVLNVE
jgi:hypothetical protein